MDVRVVTVTARPENLWFGEMLSSVAEGLPTGVPHIVVHSAGGAKAWNRDLWAACQGADAVAVVDDDDRVLPGDPGIAFLTGVSYEGAGNRRAAAQQYNAYLRQSQQGDAAQYAYSRLKGWGYVR